MGNISDHLPKESKTVQAIYDHYKKVGDAEPTRGYLGASIIGHPCERYLWYCFRQCCKPDLSGRMYRLFTTGDLEEARLTADLRAIGCEVHDVQPPPEDYSEGYPNGYIYEAKQFKVEALGGHFSGHMDGCALGIPEAPKTWHVLEFKTHNAKSFRELKKKGVKESKPQHYAQMQIYMHLTGMRRALYLARNKDTDELYSERIRYNATEADILEDRAEEIITSATPPARLSSRPDYYQCRWCDAKAICWGTESPEPALPVPQLSCRQCCHATPILDEEGGQWKCEKDLGATGYYSHKCTEHLTLPDLLPFAEPGDYGGNDIGQEWIVFHNCSDRSTWRHGNGPGCISSEELTKIPASALGDETIQAAKDLFGATVTDCEQDILQRYPESDSRIIWKGPATQFVEKWREIYSEDLTALQPVGQNCNPDSHVVELPGGRVAICWTETNQGEIREGVE